MKSPLKFPSFNPSAITALLITIGFCALAVIDNMALTSCASSPFANETYTYSDGATPITITGFGAWCENNLPTIRAATKSSVVITANVLSTHNAKAVSTVIADAKATEVPLQAVLSKSNPSLSDLDAALSTANINDPSGIFASVIQPGLVLTSGYITQLQSEGAPAKVGVDVLTVVVNGINDAILVLSPTTWMHLHPAKDLRAPFGSREYASIYDLR